jgi:non-ribosomal peptide synthetase component E (peptide arylation enzyme)
LEIIKTETYRRQSCDNITTIDINGTTIDNPEIIPNAMNQYFLTIVDSVATCFMSSCQEQDTKCVTTHKRVSDILELDYIIRDGKHLNEWGLT